ncbi:VIT family-domain-containing protein [Crassisporium funariophilum]|nr:VIT family-domain-containing protein [Crassisporium funariophilum]
MSDSSLSSTPTVVPLPPRPDNPVKQRKPPVWPIDASEPGVHTPPAAKCARNAREDGICCKELKHDERTLIDPDVVRDVVIGLSDGLTVPFALTAGLSSLGESKLVVLGGIAELIAGAISMGIGGFLASQSERDHYRYLRHHTAQRVIRSCAGEMEREVSAVLGPVGVDDKTCRAVAQSLREVEEEQGSGFLSGGRGTDAESASLRWSNEVGLTAFLLKFGQGLEEIPNRRMYVSAFTIGMGYLLGGLIPLLPYFFIPRAHIALIYSSIVTGIVLLIFGAVKARVTGASQTPAGYVWGAFSTLMVGGLAAAAAFGIVRALEGGAG